MPKLLIPHIPLPHIGRELVERGIEAEIVNIGEDKETLLDKLTGLVNDRSRAERVSDLIGNSGPGYWHKDVLRSNKDVISGGGENDPYIVSHEAGHAVDYNREDANPRRMYGSRLLRPSSGGIGLALSTAVPAAYAALSKNKYRGLAALVPAALAAPTIIQEVRANRAGRDIVRSIAGEEGVERFNKEVATPNLLSYLKAPAAGAAIVGLAMTHGKLLKRAMMEKHGTPTEKKNIRERILDTLKKDAR